MQFNISSYMINQKPIIILISKKRNIIRIVQLFDQWEPLTIDSEVPQRLHIVPSLPERLMKIDSFSEKKLIKSPSLVNKIKKSPSQQKQVARLCSRLRTSPSPSTPQLQQLHKRYCFRDEKGQEKKIINQIGLVEKQLKRLKQKKQLLEWDAEREAKRIKENKEKQQKLEELKWQKQQWKANQDLVRRQRQEELSFKRQISQERKEFRKSANKKSEVDKEIYQNPKQKINAPIEQNSFVDKSVEELKRKLKETLRKKEQMEKELREVAEKGDNYNQKYCL